MPRASAATKVPRKAGGAPSARPVVSSSLCSNIANAQLVDVGAAIPSTSSSRIASAIPCWSSATAQTSADWMSSSQAVPGGFPGSPTLKLASVEADVTSLVADTMFSSILETVRGQQPYRSATTTCDTFRPNSSKTSTIWAFESGVWEKNSSGGRACYGCFPYFMLQTLRSSMIPPIHRPCLTPCAFPPGAWTAFRLHVKPLEDVLARQSWQTRCVSPGRLSPQSTCSRPSHFPRHLRQSGRSGVRAGIIRSSPAAQGIVRIPSVSCALGVHVFSREQQR